MIWDSYKTKLLIEAKLVIGPNWVMIARIVGGCSNIQCQTKFQSLMRRQDFSAEYVKAERKLRLSMNALLPKTKSPHVAIAPLPEYPIPVAIAPLPEYPIPVAIAPLPEYPIPMGANLDSNIYDLLKKISKDADLTIDDQTVDDILKEVSK
eukprot:scaffold9494_cov78-Skeletonema_dohrnii-CCMP3373.AAC.2